MSKVDERLQLQMQIQQSHPLGDSIIDTVPLYFVIYTIYTLQIIGERDQARDQVAVGETRPTRAITQEIANVGGR